MGFKKDFTWGVASSAYQIEGAWSEDGKGLSVWDVYSHENGNIANGHTGDVACDFYHKFKDDIKLMKELGIRAYRFSISWTRIFPNGIGEVNEKGVKFYSDVIDELLKNGIEPYIALFHWDYPYALNKKGGWLNEDSVKWFAEYAGKVSELYSDRVENFITFNEPQCFVGYGYLAGVHAPGYKVSYKDIFQICHNVLKAHGSAVIAIRKNARKPVKIGYAPTCGAMYPTNETKEVVEATRKKYFSCPSISREVMWNVAWWSDPVVLGRYPEDGLKMYSEYLPKITEEDMKLISQPLDFYGQNIYNGREVELDDAGNAVFVERKQGFSKTGNQWPVTPKCLYWGPKFLYERYKLPIVITENGMAENDVVSLDSKVHDPNRIDFLNRYLDELEKATNDGVDVSGYFVWTLLDNFEWTRGYNDRFGIVYVDYETQKRIPKDSAFWYKEYIEKNAK
ncbi:MAG: beta-glucosidase [Clostridia bacterium]|nr:beta-glucosidase [Clostridia bacterium]